MKSSKRTNLEVVEDVEQVVVDVELAVLLEEVGVEGVVELRAEVAPGPEAGGLSNMSKLGAEDAPGAGAGVL